MSAFEVEVISDPIRLMPNSGFNFDDPWVKTSPEYDTRLVKPAILFADRVHLVSSRSTIHHFVGMHGWRITNMPMRQLDAYLHLSTSRDPEDLEFLGLTTGDLAEPAIANTVLAAHRSRGLDGEATEEAFSNVVIPFWEQHIDKITKVAGALRSIWVDRHHALIAPELTDAIDRDILTVQGWVEDLPPHERMFTADDDFLAEGFAGMLERLQDPARVALLDPALGPQPRGRDAVKPDPPALLANSIISRLPGLDDLPLIEVIDLREDLKDYLPHFRSEMVRLSEDLAHMGDPESVTAEVDRRWYRDIAPAMEEIRREVAAARYPRKLLDAVTTDPAAIASGAGSLVVAAGGLAVGLSALLPAMAAAAYPLLKAKALSNQQMEEAQTNKLFFLYALRDRLTA